ncbi:hypothetical protein ACVWWN_003580 [Mycobacterium sp. URHB0021]|jgi:hypothetical protein
MFPSADVSERISVPTDRGPRTPLCDRPRAKRSCGNAPITLAHVIAPALTTMRSESVHSVSGDGNRGTRTTSSTAMAGRYRLGPVLIVRLP